MQASARVLDLINAASVRAGNDSKLAALIEATPSRIHDWKERGKPCPVEYQALMAEVADRDPREEIVQALIERNANTPRGEKLVSALGKGLMASTGAIPFMLSANDALASNIPVGIELLRCIFRAFL